MFCLKLELESGWLTVQRNGLRVAPTIFLKAFLFSLVLMSWLRRQRFDKGKMSGIIKPLSTVSSLQTTKPTGGNSTPNFNMEKEKKNENIQISSQSPAKVNGINTAFEHGYLAEIREQHGADVRDSLYNRSLMCLPFSLPLSWMCGCARQAASWNHPEDMFWEEAGDPNVILHS